MDKAIRFDRGELRKPTRNAAGFLRADAFVTRVGVFEYQNADGTIRRELRHPEEVFAADSLATLELIPVTREHPPQLVNDSNAKQLAVGTTGERAERADRFVKTALQVTDRETISDIESGRRRDLSCGYLCDKDLSPGVTAGIDGVEDGIPFDLIQRNIRYNHVATTERGRAGPEVSIPRLDSEAVDADVAVMVADSYSSNGNNQRGAPKPMETITIDGVDYEVSKAAAQAYRKQTATHTDAIGALEKERDEQTARADSAEETRDAEKKRADELEKKTTDATSDEAIAKAVAARVALVTDAAKALAHHKADKDSDGNAIDLAPMADSAIREAVIKAASPAAELDGKSADYMAARFDSVIEALPTGDENTDADKKAEESRNAIQAAAAAAANKDGDDPDAEKARQKMIADSESAYLKPTIGTLRE